VQVDLVAQGGVRIARPDRRKIFAATLRYGLTSSTRPTRGSSGSAASKQASEVDDEPRIVVPRDLILLSPKIARGATSSIPSRNKNHRLSVGRTLRTGSGMSGTIPGLRRQQLDRRRREESTRAACADGSSEGGAVALALPDPLQHPAADQARPRRTTQGPENLREWTAGRAP
jgi:hypothetical protein